MPEPTLTYTLMAFDMHHKKSLLYRAAPDIPTLHKLLDIALHRGARIISIRLIHELPEPKGDA